MRFATAGLLPCRPWRARPWVRTALALLCHRRSRSGAARVPSELATSSAAADWMLGVVADPKDRCGRRAATVAGARLGVVRQAGELALDIPIPPQAADRALPSAAHRLVGLAVRLVAGRDLSLEVAVLGLDDFVVVLAVVLDVAGAAELLAGHGLHGWHGTAARPWGLLES